MLNGGFMEKNCGNCEFFLRNRIFGETHKSLDGVCRRYPPSTNGFPVTNAPNYCGEFSQETEVPVGRKDVFKR